MPGPVWVRRRENSKAGLGRCCRQAKGGEQVEKGTAAVSPASANLRASKVRFVVCDTCLSIQPAQALRENAFRIRQAQYE